MGDVLILSCRALLKRARWWQSESPTTRISLSFIGQSSEIYMSALGPVAQHYQALKLNTRYSMRIFENIFYDSVGKHSCLSSLSIRGPYTKTNQNTTNIITSHLHQYAVQKIHGPDKAVEVPPQISAAFGCPCRNPIWRSIRASCLSWIGLNWGILLGLRT